MFDMLPLDVSHILLYILAALAIIIIIVYVKWKRQAQQASQTPNLTPERSGSTQINEEWQRIMRGESPVGLNPEETEPTKGLIREVPSEPAKPPKPPKPLTPRQKEKMLRDALYNQFINQIKNGEITFEFTGDLKLGKGITVKAKAKEATPEVDEHAIPGEKGA